MKLNIGNIISANIPLVHIVNKEKKDVNCDYCLVVCGQLKRCSGCKRMFYCNQLCQKEDWAKHKLECKIYQDNYDILSHNIDRFLLRLYLFLKHKPQSITSRYSLFFDETIGRTYGDLMMHKSEISTDNIRCRTFDLVCYKFENCGISFDKNELFEHFCKICINSYSILNLDLNEIGTGLYIAESKFNHSCNPNASAIFNGIDLEVRCIKPIDSADSITINYIDLKVSKSIRQKMLKEQYYFECHCTRCENDFPQGFDYEYLKKSIEKFDEYIGDKKWEEGFKTGRDSIEAFMSIYNGLHPDLSVQMFRLMKIRLLLSEDLDNEGIQLVSNTERMIKSTHGMNHELYKEYRFSLNLD